MTSLTSFFNARLLSANLKRNRYLMLLQTISLFLASSLTIILANAQHPIGKAMDANVEFSAFVRAFGGLNSALILIMVIFSVMIPSFSQSYLYKKRSIDFYHSLPYTRTELYVTNFLTGLISFVVPLILIFGFNTIIYFSMGFSHYIDYTVLAKGLLFSILFYSILYSVTMFAASLSGNIIAELTMVMFVFGIIPAFKGILQLCLTTWFDKIALQNFNSIPYFFPMLFLSKISFPQSSILIGEILYCIGYALVFAALGSICYRFRKSEDCNRFYVFTWVKRIFKYSLTFLVSLLLGIVFQQMVSNHHILFMVAGFVIGGFLTFITIQSVFEKSFKAMFANMNAFIPFCIITCVLMLFISADVFHVNDYIPKLKNVESIGMEFNGSHSTYLENGVSTDVGIDVNKEVVLADEQNVQLLYEMIQKGSENVANGSESYASPVISYQTNTILGHVRRTVTLKKDLLDKTIAKIFDSKEYKDQYATMDFLKRDRQIISVDIEIAASDYHNIYTRDSSSAIKKPQMLAFLNTLESDMKTHTYEQMSSSKPYGKVYVTRQSKGLESKTETFIIYNCYADTIAYSKANY